MSYLAPIVNGCDVRNKYVAAMDLRHAKNADEAYENFYNYYFSSNRKQYLNKAFQLTKDKSMFWPTRTITEMLDEIFINNSDNYDARKMAQDIDLLKSEYLVYTSNHKKTTYTEKDIQKRIKSFETKYKYKCPETFVSYWLNNGAYISLMYGAKYEGLTFPGHSVEETLSKLNGMALEVLNDHNHDVDRRLFNIVYYIYSQQII